MQVNEFKKWPISIDQIINILALQRSMTVEGDCIKLLPKPIQDWLKASSLFKGNSSSTKKLFTLFLTMIKSLFLNVLTF